ncbi:MAG: DNA-directed RNA polymerase subunit omega [Candidatus Hydrogenedentota bacterium]
MHHYTLEDFKKVDDKIDSLYRVINITYRRAIQVNRPEARPLVARTHQKPTIVALEEVREGKVGFRTSAEEGDDFDVE